MLVFRGTLITLMVTCILFANFYCIEKTERVTCKVINHTNYKAPDYTDADGNTYTHDLKPYLNVKSEKYGYARINVDMATFYESKDSSTIYFTFKDYQINEYFNKNIDFNPISERKFTYGVIFVILLIILMCTTIPSEDYDPFY